MEAWQHQPFFKTAPRLQSYNLAVSGVALLLIAVAVVLDDGPARLIFLLAGCVLAAASILFWALSRRETTTTRSSLAAVEGLVAQDPVPAFLTGQNRVLLYANAAADTAFDAWRETLLTDALRRDLSDAATLLSGMEQEIRFSGAARREVSARDALLSVTGHATEAGHILWRVDRRPAPKAEPPPDLPVPSIRLDARDEISAINTAAHEFLGAHATSVALFAPRDRLTAGEVSDILTPNGVMRCLVLEAPRDDGGRDIFLFPAPQALSGEGEWTFFDALPVPLLKLSDKGVVLRCNRHAQTLLGKQTLEGARLSELMEGPGRPVQDWFDDIVAGRIPGRGEVLRLCAPGPREVHAQTTLTRTVEDGETVVIAVLNDATSLKSLEQQVTQSQKMQAIGQLAGGVAHDFNNLLTAISGHCDLLLLRHEQSDEDYADLIQISQNANRAAALVGQRLA
jgi:two-component system cell cycle sensor histidine kinase/response regulator CckA